MKKYYLKLKITINVEYVGVENGNHVWLTQIMETETKPMKFYQSTSRPQQTVFQIADHVASWYRSPKS